jgi:hypothetical protein
LAALALARLGGAGAAELTEPLDVAPGASASLGAATVTASGGFRGYRKGADDDGETYAFVRDGDRPGEYALIIVDVVDASDEALQVSRATREAFAYAMMVGHATGLVDSGWTWAEPLDPTHKCSYGDVEFFCATLNGHGEYEGRKAAYASATLALRYVGLRLETTSSLWPATLDALAAFAASIRLADGPRGQPAR